jgi:hypothetical protein
VNFPGGGSATIIAYITRDTSGKIISRSADFNVGVFLGAPASLSGLRIHKGAAGVNGPSTIATDLGAGGPTGLMRAQLNSAAFSVPIAVMTSANTVPPVTGNTASAVGVSISVAAHDPAGNLTSGLIILDSVYNFGKQTTLTGFHLHKGQPGSNGPIIFD